MKLSNTELEYLRVSLTSQPIIRADSRHAAQFRPVEGEIDVLPMTNGSARVRSPDGSECIIGIKAKVVPTHKDLIDVSVGIAGIKDNDHFPQSLAVVLKQVLSACPEITQGSLILNSKYAFRLFVDCVVLSYTSHPLSLLSMGCFQALKSCRLPKLQGVLGDDERDLLITGEEVEIPQFDDDWSASLPLCQGNWTPPLLFIVAIVGSTVLIDPTMSEEQVSEASLFITWKNGKISAPIKTLNPVSSEFTGPVDPQTIFDAYDVVKQCAPTVEKSLTEAM